MTPSTRLRFASSDEMVAPVEGRPPDAAAEALRMTPLQRDWAAAGIGPRTIGLAACALQLFALADVAMPANGPIAWALRLMSSALVMGVLPGVMVTMVWRPRRELTLMELLGFGVAISFAVAQGLTIAALLLHVSARTNVWLVVAGNGAAALALIAARPAIVVRAPRGDRALLMALAVVAALLYLKGAPYSSTEDNIHVSVIRRLMYLQAPRLDNIYFAPGVIYTYPFPGIHYLLALIGRFGDFEAFFLYTKLRALWGPAALTFVWLTGRMLLGGPAAAASIAAALVFVLSGAFAVIPGFFWGQLAPVSHASDLAMGVVLPGLLVLTFYFLEAEQRRDRAFFFFWAMSLAIMLTIVHIREVVQYVVYVGAYGAFLLAVDRRHPHLPRLIGLGACLVAIVLAYVSWHNQVVVQVNDLTVAKRAELRRIASETSFLGLLGSQEHVMNGFFAAYSPAFYGFNALFLAGLPLIGLVFARRTLMPLIVASTLVYVLIIRFPLVAIPYVYFTYFEILFTPIRNVIFFMHVLAGATLFVVAVRLARSRPLAAAFAGGMGGLLLAWTWVPERSVFLEEHINLVYLPLAVGLAWALWDGRRQPRAPAGPRWLTELRSLVASPPRTWGVTFAAMLLPMAVVSFTAAGSSPLALGDSVVNTPTDLLANMRCLEQRDVHIPLQKGNTKEVTIPHLLSCPPPARLVHWAATALPVDAVLAVSKWNRYPAPAFMPQQAIVWSSLEPFFLDEENFLARYYAQYRRSVRAYGDQPFFNDRETAEERRDFIQSLGVTHVLVDPQTYALMTRVLQRDSRFTRIYDADRWAVWEVRTR